MTKLYQIILFTGGVFLLGLLMYCLRQDVTAVNVEQVLPLLGLYAVGLLLGLFMKPVLE